MKQNYKDLLYEKTKYRIKYVLYATSFIWVLYLRLFLHELGHAVAGICLGGTVCQFVVNLDLTGKVLYQLPIDSSLPVTALFLMSGGIGAALFFIALTHWSKGFVIPGLFSLFDVYAEAMCLADARFVATNIMGILVVAICLRLFWKFETQHQDNKKKRLEQSDNLDR